jgi:hypothetical protein
MDMDYLAPVIATTKDFAPPVAAAEHLKSLAEIFRKWRNKNGEIKTIHYQLAESLFFQSS